MRVRLRNPDRDVDLAGARPVRAVLAELSIDPDTVLVIRERNLLTREDWLEDEDEIEVRPVISGGARRGNRMRCRRGQGTSGVGLRRHHPAVCQGFFLRYVR